MPKNKKNKKKSKYTPQTFHIEVDVDAKGNFKYTANGQDARSIRPHLTDQISWSVKLTGVPVPFQVDFPGFSPFGITTRTVRSLFEPTKPLSVTMPPNYHGNLVLAYTVTLVNGWSDDPDIVPVLSDGTGAEGEVSTILLSLDGSGDLVINSADASFPAGEVLWKWDGAPQDDFSLKFDAPVPTGWPPSVKSQSFQIAIDLEAAAADSYIIECTNLGVSAPGNLTIT